MTDTTEPTAEDLAMIEAHLDGKQDASKAMLALQARARKQALDSIEWTRDNGYIDDAQAETAIGQAQAFSLLDLLSPALVYEKGNAVAVMDGAISFGLPRDMAAWLASVDNEKRKYLLLNSAGGNAVTGVAVYNLLKMAGNVDVVVTSMAASAASIVLQGGAERTLLTGSVVQIHNAHLTLQGNAKALRRAADAMETMDANLVTIYAARTGKKSEAGDIRALMDKDIPLTATRAVELGYADRLTDDAPTKGMRMPGEGEDVATAENVVAPAPVRRAKASDDWFMFMDI